jgi:choline dehydrogenase-like flavoprotein
MSLRMSDLELKAARRDGVGEDWPISYADLAPYYDRVERFLRVCGTAEGLAQIPDGPFLDPPPSTRGERGFKAAVEGRWGTRTVTSARMALAPPDATLEAARSTGRLDLFPDSVASRVLVDGTGGRARGVAFVDRLSHEERELTARVIVLCASAIESTRLLLNSASPDHPEGLGNSSGVLGHYLMDHTYGIGLDGIVPQRSLRRGERSSHGCAIPAFRNASEHEVDFIRGYGVELQAHPPTGGRLEQLRSLGRPWGGRFWMRTFGEVLPRYENRVSLNPEKTDAWGIPAAHIVCRYGENEELMAADQLRNLQEMAEAAGWQVEKTCPRIAPPGLSVHEMGTARMGSDPNSSVLNSHNQSWDVVNLFVTDGACFTSGGFQNPTLTMMALTARACDYVVEGLKKREL